MESIFTKQLNEINDTLSGLKKQLHAVKKEVLENAAKERMEQQKADKSDVTYCRDQLAILKAAVVAIDENQGEVINRIDMLEARMDAAENNNSQSGTGVHYVVGDRVTIGRYNGNPLTWQVIESSEHSALLLCDSGIEAMAYHNVWGNVVWETSFVRQWLNDEFFKTAFTSGEREQIELSHISSQTNSIYSTECGNDTNDKVFLLSLNEVAKHLPLTDQRLCIASSKAINDGVAYDYETNSCNWWLRTPGLSNRNAVTILADGFVNTSGSGVTKKDIAVRPAIRLHV